MNADMLSASDVYRQCLDAFPAPTFIVDADVRFHYFNKAARPLLGPHPDQILSHRSGEALHCIHATEAPGGCGHAAACEQCVIRQAVKAAFSGAEVNRHIANMRLDTGAGGRLLFLLVTAAPFDWAGRKLVLLVLENVDELIQLRKIIPICARCKRVRNDQEFWTEVETYFKEHLDVAFSHSICPHCMRTLHPDIADEVYPPAAQG